MIPVLSYFGTPDGLKLFKAKGEGDSIMPYGCYYDKGERDIQLKIRLEQDIFPLLNYLMLRISKDFDINEEQLQIDAWIEYETGEKCNNLINLENLCYQRNYRKSTDDFGFLVNFNCSKKEIKWGTQLHVFIEKITWQDEGANKDYPVWYIGIGDFELNLDCEMSIAEIQQVVDKVMQELWRCFRIESTGVWED